MTTLFFSSVAHDLRTPLNAMMASNERLKRELKNNPRLGDVLLI
jgi:signal transduction histidine kinase